MKTSLTQTSGKENAERRLRREPPRVGRYATTSRLNYKTFALCSPMDVYCRFKFQLKKGEKMRSWGRFVLGVGLVTAFFALGVPTHAAQASKARQIARGKYLVEHVGMCGDCHSPHDQKGQVPAGKALMGSVLGFQPIHPFPGWMPAAPPIAGLPMLTDEEAMKVLTEAVLPGGKPPRPPMPRYRMSRSDAAAIVAYLRSLKRAGD